MRQYFREINKSISKKYIRCVDTIYNLKKNISNKGAIFKRIVGASRVYVIQIKNRYLKSTIHPES